MSTQPWGEAAHPCLPERGARLPSNPGALPTRLILWPLVQVHPSSSPPKIIHSPNSISKQYRLLKIRGKREEEFYTTYHSKLPKMLLEKFFKFYIAKLSSPQIFVATLPPKGMGSKGRLYSQQLPLLSAHLQPTSSPHRPHP